MVMRLYLDSSALVKRYIHERGSDAVLERCREATEIGLSILSYPELISCFNRLLRERKLTEGDYRRLKRELRLDLDGAAILDPTPDIISLAVRCLELEPLRAADALHLATARAFACGLFLTSDRAQRAAAGRLGMRAELV
jgi:predicted nucleic acid-binding protein